MFSLIEIKKQIKLPKDISKDQIQEVLSLIKQDFQNRKIQEFETFGTQFSFKIKFFNRLGRYHIFALIDKCVVSAFDNSIKLSFSIKRFTMMVFIVSVLFPLPVSILSGTYFLPFVAMAFLFGINFLILQVRLSMLISNLKRKIETQVFDYV